MEFFKIVLRLLYCSAKKTYHKHRAGRTHKSLDLALYAYVEPTVFIIALLSSV